VIETHEALQRAKAAQLDLVEVAPQSAPPVCRIMDYGKWKYQQKKKEQKAKSHSKHSELKEIRLRPGTDDHDLDIKADKAREFFEEGDKVQFTLLFRGRQMAHKEIGFRLFERLAGRFEDVAHVEMIPRLQGRRMTMMMAPGAKTGGGREAVVRLSAADRAADRAAALNAPARNPNAPAVTRAPGAPLPAPGTTGAAAPTAASPAAPSAPAVAPRPPGSPIGPGVGPRPPGPPGISGPRPPLGSGPRPASSTGPLGPRPPLSKPPVAPAAKPTTPAGQPTKA
jgi:translation initiation factor IF-3